MLSGQEVKCYNIDGFKGKHGHPLLGGWGSDYIYEHKTATAVVITDDSGTHIVVKAVPKVDSNPTFSVKSEYVITMKSLQFNQEGYAMSFGEFRIINAEHNVPIPGLASPLNARLDSKEIVLGQKEGTSHLLVRLQRSQLQVEVEPSQISKAGASKVVGAAQKFFTRTTVTGSLQACSLSDAEIASYRRYL